MKRRADVENAAAAALKEAALVSGTTATAEYADIGNRTTDDRQTESIFSFIKLEKAGETQKSRRLFFGYDPNQFIPLTKYRRNYRFCYRVDRKSNQSRDSR